MKPETRDRCSLSSARSRPEPRCSTDDPLPARGGSERIRRAHPDLRRGVAMSAEGRIKELGLTLPDPPKPGGNYVPAVRVGNLLFLSGHGPSRVEGKPSARGKVGRDLSTEDGYKVAREVGVNLLGTARALLGSLDKVKRIVKVLGMVNSAEGFGEQPKVINGFSDLMVEVFGEQGRHARSAVGMAELPSGIPVEIEMILEVE